MNRLITSGARVRSLRNRISIDYHRLKPMYVFIALHTFGENVSRI